MFAACLLSIELGFSRSLRTTQTTDNKDFENKKVNNIEQTFLFLCYDFFVLTNTSINSALIPKYKSSM